MKKKAQTENEFRYCVYKHIVPNGRVYIGSTGRPTKDRWNNGKGYARNPPFSRDIEKYGWSRIKHVIVGYGLTKEQARSMEKEMIKHTCSEIGELCYNQRDGGISRPIGSNKSRDAKEERRSKRKYKKKRAELERQHQPTLF